MKLKSIKNSYLNISGNQYGSEFINLTKIIDDKISFGSDTLFLTNSQKSVLNQDEISLTNNTVYITESEGKYSLICNTPIEEYKNQRVKSHELVLPNEIQGMLSNLYGYNAETAPVLLAHTGKINLKTVCKSGKEKCKTKIGEKIVYTFTDVAADEILAQYIPVKELYVADGHHRLYTTSLSELKDNMLSCIVSIDDLDILPIYRVIKDIDAERYERVVEFIKSKFNYYFDKKSLKKGEVRLTYRGESVRVELIDLNSDAFWNNDVYRLNTQIISQVFRIFNDDDLEFIGSSDEKLKNIHNDEVLVEMYPVQKEEFIEVIKKGNILPPKSTWFTPKFPSFMVMSKYK